MDQNELRVLMKAFKNRQVQYCPLPWMFHSRILNNMINEIHENAPRIAYRDQNSSIESLLEEDAPTTSHVKKLESDVD